MTNKATTHSQPFSNPVQNPKEAAHEEHDNREPEKSSAVNRTFDRMSRDALLNVDFLLRALLSIVSIPSSQDLFDSAANRRSDHRDGRHSE